MKVNLKSLPMFDEKAFNKSAFEARKEKDRMLQENADLKNKIDNVPYQLPHFDQDRNAKIMKESFLNKTKDILDKDFSFLLINCYTTGFSPTSLYNILSLTFKNNKILTGEIGLPVTENNLVLPCGIYGKVSKY